METSMLQPLVGAIFMGLGAGFLTYAYSDKLMGRNRKKRSHTPEGYYDPRKDDSGSQTKMFKAVSAGFFMGIMCFIYFSNK